MDYQKLYFPRIGFQEEGHRYSIDGKFYNYPSVSKIVSLYYDAFESDKISKRVAKRRKVSQKEILELWDNIRDKACELGTETHEFAEYKRFEREDKNNLEKAVLKFHEEFFKDSEYEIVAEELDMFSEKYKFFGKTDLILKNKKTGLLYPADYKTNKDLDKSYGYMNMPFQYYPCNNFIKYQIQLSLYQILIEESISKVGGRILIWLKRDGTYEIRKCIDFTEVLKEDLKNKIPWSFQK